MNCFYNLGKAKDSGYMPFWDAVVITTADADQQRAFQLQLTEKLNRKELPIDLPFHIITDPEGPKLGG